MTFEFYAISSSPTSRNYLATVTVTTSVSYPNQFSVTIPTAGLANGDLIVATATVPGNGTSGFSNVATVTSNPFTVTNISTSGGGSLFQVIKNADLDATDSGVTIDFGISSMLGNGGDFNSAGPRHGPPCNYAKGDH